jgi:hypothetical protein
MSCALESYASTLVGSPTDQCQNSVATIEPTATEAKKYRRKTAPRAMPDSTHRYPEYVWGDEGPVNE